MSINARVRLIAEGTGGLIQDLGEVTPYCSVNDEIVLSENERAPTVYKVEKMRSFVDVRHHSSALSAPKYSITLRVDIIVSVVP